jgi:F-type H+-transporting ATPase subunit b
MGDLLTPDLGLAVWTVVTFLILVGVLKAFAWGPLLKAVEEREARLKADREGAENARAEAERIQKELEAQLAGIQAKTKDLLAAATKDGETLRAKLKAEAEADAAAIKSKTAAELIIEKQKLVGELRREVASLSVLAAEKLLHKSVDAGVQKSVLDGFFKDLESTKKAGSN